MQVPQPRNKRAPTPTREVKKFDLVRGPTRAAWKLGIYGDPGVGKSTLAALCPGAVFADIENSMEDLDVTRVAGIECWEDLRDWVQQSRESGKIYGIDSMSVAEDWCADYIIRTKTDSSGMKAQTSIEDFKYKSGAKFVADEFRLLLYDIELSFKAGANWIMTAHNKVSVFNNPDDKNFIMHSPDLLETKDVSSKSEWVRFCDHVAYIGKDIVVDRGKAKGGATRTIYMDGSNSRICKHRGLEVDLLPWVDETDNKFWEIMRVIKEESK